MSSLPVHWSEGMFLRPHHFQAADRFWTDAFATYENWDHPYGYGLRRISLSEAALANSQIQVDACEARLRDGTLIRLKNGQTPDRVDLKPALEGASAPLTTGLAEAFARTDAVTVYLAVPRLRLGSVNVLPPGEAGKSRYRAEVLEFQDESRGGNDQPVEFRQLNVKVLLSTDDLSGYEVLPIARVQRAGDREATPRLDPGYFPPVLAVEAWAPLARDIVRAIFDIISKKSDVLAEQVQNRSIGFTSQEPGDLDRLFMLSRLNEGAATLGTLAFSQGLHPFVAYTELCRIVGQLAIFEPARRTDELPRYDHDDLARIFRAVKERIERLLNAVRDYEYEQRFFVGVGLGLQVSLEPKWFNADWQWYVGVARGDLSEAECRDLLSAGQLDWKLGSSRQVEILFRHRAEGLQLVPLERPPRALPASRDWQYYQVSRQNAAWKDVQETQSLALRLKDSLILNREKLQGERQLVVSFRGRQVPLQFALFAVPSRP